MQDRLLEVIQLTPRGEVDTKQYLSHTKDGLIPGYQEKVQKVRQLLLSVEQNNKDIVQLQKLYNNATENKDEQQITKGLNKLLDKNNKENQQIEKQMKLLDAEIENDKQDPDKGPQDPETRMKIDILRALNSKVQEVLQESHNVQKQFQINLKQKITRQTRYLDPNLTDEQLEEFTNDPSKAQEMLQQKLSGQASLQLQGAVSDIQDKYREIQLLEKSVEQVYQLFLDLAILVQQQGSLLNDIEDNLKEGQKNVKKGNKDLHKAKKHHISIKKKKCCILLLVLILAAGVALPVIFFI
ncbi:t-SNARE [Pseudocohnilembus persalinus]|uniref:t-SNARE n=1 Tax=Pseudocohnilembus persalinus TaxID=266149 RepID=A0A0V0QUG6_PSEPJ|nr:t-SNARE [Pseudocohnilembus persalinus]|eukprot:KRX05616.1 t-SNARE [Pseudocohnilembus persalinus]